MLAKFINMQFFVDSASTDSRFHDRVHTSIDERKFSAMALAHPFLYSAPRHDYKRLLNLASTRDPEANAQLRIALHGLGYDFGESILNFPPNQSNFDLLPEESLTRVELPFVHEEDILVLTTRAPLSDGIHMDSKKIEPSNSNIERALFFQLWRYFKVCSRSFVALTDEAASFLPIGKKNRAEMTFYQQGCRYMHLQALQGRRSPRSPLGERTAAFLLRFDEIWPSGPGLVCAFGLNAISTLAWCSMLRYRCPWMLENRGLTMVELHPTEAPERASTYEWTRDWKMTPVFTTDGELPPRPEETGLQFLI